MVFIGRFDEVILDEVAMVVDYYSFANFVGCLESFVVVGMVDFVGYCNCDFVCFWFACSCKVRSSRASRFLASRSINSVISGVEQACA